MDNEQPITQTDVETLPRITPFSPNMPVPASTGAAAAIDSGERNGVFRHLVKDDTDIAGLVAYSIYKQNKLDWLTAFEASKGRSPDDAELSSYIIGEGTPRRLSTYRHLAEATLAGRGPDVEGGGMGVAPLRRRTGATSTRAFNPGLIAAGALVVLLLAIGFWIATHYTLASR